MKNLFNDNISYYKLIDIHKNIKIYLINLVYFSRNLYSVIVNDYNTRD